MSKEIFESELFTFVLGQEEQQIKVHSEAIARLSPTLTELMRGPLRESQEKVVRWDDMEVKDFLRLCQFAYAGDYTPAKPIENVPIVLKRDIQAAKQPEPDDEYKAVEEPPDENPAEKDDIWGTWDVPPKSGKKSKHRAQDMRSTFQSEFLPDGRTWNDPKLLYEPTGNTGISQSLAPVFLSHAHLYVIGDKYGVANLVSLALYKLHRTLKLCRVWNRRTSDIIDLVKFVYDNTQGLSNDKLRALVIDYIVMNVTVIGKDPAFSALLEEGGEFVSEFWKMMQERL